MKKLIAVFLLSLFCTHFLLSQETGDTTDSENTTVSDGLVFDRYTPGLIFSTSNILLDLSGYQSGVGVKLKAEDYALRGLVRLSYESSDDLFESELGLTYEKPFFTGKVSPYWGVELKGGYSLDRDEADSNNWTEASVFTGGISALFGTEVYIFDFLSLFAEYSLGGSLSRTAYTSVSSGVKSETTTLNYYLGTGLGNTASIGIVVYLEKLDIASEDSEEKKKESK